MIQFILNCLECLPVRLCLLGSIVILFVRLILRLSSNPIHRLQIGNWTIGVLLLLPILCLLPTWIAIPVIREKVESESSPKIEDQLIAAKPENPDSDSVKPKERELGFVTNDRPTLDDAMVPLTVTQGVIDQITSQLQQPEPEHRIPSTLVEAGNSAETKVLPIPTQVSSSRFVALSSISWTTLFSIGYGTLSLFLLIWLFIGQIGLRRLWRASRPAPKRWSDQLNRLQTMGKPIEVRIVDRVLSPLCFGIFKGKILIPYSLSVCASEREMNWILAHEANHLKCRDPLRSLLLGIVQLAVRSAKSVIILNIILLQNYI